jgi:hypothetical protein
MASAVALGPVERGGRSFVLPYVMPMRKRFSDGRQVLISKCARACLRCCDREDFRRSIDHRLAHSLADTVSPRRFEVDQSGCPNLRGRDPYRGRARTAVAMHGKRVLTPCRDSGERRRQEECEES